MKVGLGWLAILYRLPCLRPRTVEHFGKRPIRVKLDSEVVVRDMVCRKSQRFLHRCFHLNLPTIRRYPIVMFLQILEEGDVVGLFGQDFPMSPTSRPSSVNLFFGNAARRRWTMASISLTASGMEIASLKLLRSNYPLSCDIAANTRQQHTMLHGRRASSDTENGVLHSSVWIQLR